MTHHRARTRPARSAQGGFTLVELLVVVIIVGVLATLGITAMRKYVVGSKAAEALNQIQNIRAAQESFRTEHMRYLNVSTGTNWYPTDPTLVAGRHKMSFHDAAGGSHPDGDRWKELRIVDLGTREFGYLVNAGNPSDVMTPPAVPPPGFAWPAPAQQREFWYVIQAIADADGDGVPAFFLASSIKGEVLKGNVGE